MVRQAELLAGRLTERPEAAVGRNVFRALVAEFRAAPDLERFRRLVQLAGKGSGRHKQRTHGYGDQLSQACEVLSAFVAKTRLELVELKSVFGWTARLLPAKGGEGTAADEAPAKRGREPVPAQTPSKFGGLGKDALAALKDLVTKKEENGE
jgi:hypothetical protein